MSKINNDFAVLNYAIKVISNKRLSKRARRLYIKTIMQMTLEYPYLLPLLEDFVFKFADNNFDFLNDFLKYLLERSLQNSITDSLAFVFYYACKYYVDLGVVNWQDIIDINDCISMLLAYKYCEQKKNIDDCKIFKDKAVEINKGEEREKDKFWLFLYEVLDETKLSSGFLKELKKNKCVFVKIKR